MIRSAHQAAMSEYAAAFDIGMVDYLASPVATLKNDYRVALDKVDRAEQAIFFATKVLGVSNKAPVVGLWGKTDTRAQKVREALVMLNKARARYNRALRELGAAFDALSAHPGAAIAVRASR